MARLVTSRYVPPGVYIGQLIRPRPGNLTADARVCNYIGKGSRFAVGKNLALRRSFVYDEALVLPSSPPYVATLQFVADGVKDLPTRLFDSVTGIELLASQWDFLKVGDDWAQIIIAPEAYNPNAAYRMDYQSVNPDVLDVLPVAQLRTIKAVSTNQDRVQFKDYEDFYIPFQFSGPTADIGNQTVASYATGVNPDGGNIGLGLATLDSAAQYNHNYNRFYVLTCTATGGAPGTYSATFEWNSNPFSGGAESAPPVPLHSSIAAPAFTVDEANPGTLVQELEYGIKINFDVAGGNFAIGDIFYLNGVGPGLLELDGRILNTNQFIDYGSINATLQLGSTGLIEYGVSNFTGTSNRKYALQVVSTAGGFGSRSVTVAYASYGETLGVNGTFTATESNPNVNLVDGIKLVVDFGAVQFVPGDTFHFEVKAPRRFYQAKDNRVLKIDVATATNPGGEVGAITGSYSTGTVEGGFGVWSAEANRLTGPTAKTGFVSLPDGLGFYARNMFRGNINGNSFAAGDNFEAAITSLEVIDWTLRARVEEIRETTAVFTDVTGAVTGVAGSPYILLNNIYAPGSVQVVIQSTAIPVSYFEVPGTQAVGLMSMPTGALRINYEYRGEEPAPGQLYYLTANYLRPEDAYNKPTLILDKNEGRTWLGPAEVDNHLYIMNELVFDNNAPGAYYTQVYDSDGDGVITRPDVVNALASHKGVSRITDLCLLSLFEALPDALSANELGNDPFEKREQMLYVGAPIGTPIGDIDTPNSLVFLARRTLQTNPQSPALGTRVLVAPTEATKTIILENGVPATVTLDGSFVAGATCALVNSFNDPASTILRRNLNGFDTLKTYTEPQNLILGQASITYLEDLGSGVFRFLEDITVHTNAEEFQLISATIQKHFVVKVVRREMDNSLIGVVPPSAQAAVALVRSTLAGILLGLLGRGLIAPFQDELGNERAFDVNADVVVQRDSQSLSKYDFFYAFWIRSPLKRLFGLYSTNSNDFGLNT